MADVREKSGPAALLLGFLGFVAFEVVAYYLLRYLTSGLGESDQMQTERNTIVSNWVKTMAFLVLHLALVIATVLGLSNVLPRRYRGQLKGWFYCSLLMSFVWLLPLFDYRGATPPETLENNKATVHHGGSQEGETR